MCPGLELNIHGRDARYGDMRKAVRSFRLLLADGRIVNVSREENADLFHLVIGGLGLFGVILDVDLELTQNDVYEKQVSLMDYKDYTGYFKKHVQNNPDMWLHFAALSISPDKNFLKEMIVASYKKSEKNLRNYNLSEEKNISRDKFFLGLSRRYSWGKTLRWDLQRILRKGAEDEQVLSRNNAMRNPIEFLEYHSAKDTDILQEYFIPVDKFSQFVDGAREIVLKNKINLLHAGGKICSGQ